jgi:predicted transcriptional regulator
MGKKTWTDEEIELLRTMYQTESISDIEEALGRKWNAIKNVIYKLGLRRDKSRFCQGIKRKKVIDLTEIDNEEKAYVLGFIAADGSIYCRKGTTVYKLSIVLSEKDKDHVFKLRDIISPESNVGTYKIPKPKKGGEHYCKDFYVSFNFAVADRYLSNNLLRHGIVPRKTYNPQIPTSVPEHLFQHWVRGYFDGDGGIYINKKGELYCDFCGYSNGEANIILEYVLKKFLEVLPFDSQAEVKNKDAVSRIRFSHNMSVHFVNWVYRDATVYLERKYQIAKNYFTEVLPEPRPPWTSADEKFLSDNYGKMTSLELADHVNRPVSSVNYKISKLRDQGETGLVKLRHWSKGEEIFIIENYNTMGVKEISSRLDKSEASIYAKVNKLRRKGYC